MISLKKFLTLVAFFMMPALSIAQTEPTSYEDMVLVQDDDGHMFYLDMFEMSGEVAAKVIPSRLGTPWKPAHLSYSQAVQICTGLGKRLATREEWMAAASNMGQNTNYTLRGDNIKDANGTLIPHIAMSRGSNAIAVTDEKQIGIDAIGTVGMTGNRAEWVVGPQDNTNWQCGSHYDQPNINRATLANICSNNPNDMTSTATARCVVDYSPSIQINYSKNVSPELLGYLDQIMVSSNIGDLLIPENEYTKAASDAERLKQP